MDIETASVLDLFSGTGCISFEFASRGAKIVHLVEKDPLYISFIKKMIREMKMDNIKPIHIDVRAYLKTCRFKYDLVFADPPYSLSWIELLPDLVASSGVINDPGLFILEHPKDLEFNSHKLFIEHRSYGGVNFSFFKSDNRIFPAEL